MAREYSYELDAFEVYHQEQETPSAINPALPALGHALSGAAGAALSNAVTYPLQLLITRLQVQKQLRGQGKDGEDGQEYEGIIDAAQKIYRDEGGITAFYAGVGQEIAKSVADSFLFFLAYSILRKARQRSTGAKKLAVTDELGFGMAAGAFAKLFTTPVQNVVTRKQTAAMMSRQRSGAKLTTRDIALQIRDEKGWLGFWAGYSATLVLTVNPGLTFLLQELFGRVNRRTVNQEGGLATFVLAASAKAVASSVTYPFSLAKTRAQVSSRAPADAPAGGNISKEDSLQDAEKKVEVKVRRNTILGEVLKIARTEGVAGLYQGLPGEVVKGFFQHGLTMLIKDRAFLVIQQLYFLLLRLLQKYPSPEELAKMAKERAKARGADIVAQGRVVVQNAANAVTGSSDKPEVPPGDIYGKGRPKA